MKMISLLLLIIFFMVLLVLNTFVFAEGGGEEDVISYTTERTASTDTICSIEGNKKTCTKTLYSGTMNYLDNGVYVPIDTTVTTSDYLTYDYEMEKGIYHAYFQDNINTGEPVRFEKDGYYFIYDLSGGKIQWAEQEGNPTKTKSIGALLSSVPTISNNNVRYNNAFAYTDVEYFVYNEMLKENFILSQLPPSGAGYLFLEYTGEIKHSSSLTIYANGEDQTDKTFQTQGKIEFRDINGKTIFYLPEPTVTDGDGNVYIGIYYIKISAGKILFNLRIAKVFLDSAVYPVVIDPTIKLQVPKSEFLEHINYYWFDGVEFGYNDSVQIKVNISTIRGNFQLSNAIFCGYINTVIFPNNGDANVSRVANNTGWREFSYSQSDFLSANLTNATQETWTSITQGTETCINVISQVKEDQSLGRVETTLRFYDVDGYLLNGELEENDASIGNPNLFFGASGTDGDEFWLSSKEHSNTSQRPYVNISYTIPNPTVDLNTPSNNSELLFKDKPFKFNFSIFSEADILNASLYLNHSGTWKINITNTSKLNWSDIVVNVTQNNFSINLTRGVFLWNVEVCDINDNCNFADDNYTITIDNSLPTVASATINNSNPTSAEDIQCNNGSVSDLDTEDTVTLHYDWYNSSDGSTFISYGLDTKTLDSTNLTTNIYWKCVIFPTDSFGESGTNKTSATVQVGSSNIAPVIDKLNLTTEEIGVISNSTNPTNNNSYVKVSINWSDANDDDVKVLACTTDSATVNGCGVGTWWNSSVNLTTNEIFFNISRANLTATSNNVYVFLVDNSSEGFLLSASKLGTFEVNFPPLPVNFSKTFLPADGTSFAQTFVNLSWTATSDPDSDSLRYFVYTNTSISSYIGRGNTTSTRFDLTSLSDTTYNWKIETLDEHNYSNTGNSSSRSFTISVAGAAPPAGGGGGGVMAVTNVTNITIITGQCNFNGICEAEFGEDFINCGKNIGGDCQFSLAQIDPLCLFFPKPEVPCIYRTGIFIKLTVLLAIISSLILLSDTIQGRKIRAYIKEKTKFDFKF